MTHSGLSRRTVLVAGFVALVYASLAAMAASCAVSHVDPSNGHARHGTQESAPHNALCAWACQATSDAGLVTESPALSMARSSGWRARLSNRQPLRFPLLCSAPARSVGFLRPRRIRDPGRPVLFLFLLALPSSISVMRIHN